MSGTKTGGPGGTFETGNLLAMAEGIECLDAADQIGMAGDTDHAFGDVQQGIDDTGIIPRHIRDGCGKCRDGTAHGADGGQLGGGIIGVLRHTSGQFLAIETDQDIVELFQRLVTVSTFLRQGVGESLATGGDVSSRLAALDLQRMDQLCHDRHQSQQLGIGFGLLDDRSAVMDGFCLHGGECYQRNGAQKYDAGFDGQSLQYHGAALLFVFVGLAPVQEVIRLNITY